MVRRVSADPWLAVSRERAAALGLSTADVRGLVRAALPAARELERAGFAQLLAGDVERVQRATARVAADDIGPVAPVAAGGVTEVAPVAAGVVAEVAPVAGGVPSSGEEAPPVLQTSNGPIPCSTWTDCRGGQFTGDACWAAAVLSGRVVDMTDATFQGCDMQRWDMSGWTLTRAVFRRSKLDGTKIRYAPLAAFPESIANGTDFDGANLRGANFTGTDLQRSTFRGADLEREPGVASANFSGTALNDADLSEADLDSALNLLQAKLVRAKLNRATLTSALTLKELNTGYVTFDGLLACAATLFYDGNGTTPVEYPEGGRRCPVGTPY